MKKEIITLCGFGDLSEEGDQGMLEDLQAAAVRHGVEFRETQYYDHELKGDATAIEALTQDLWGMPRDEWIENGLHEDPVT